MAQPQKVIALQSGRLQEILIESVAATTGATDASKLIRTGSDGRIDQTMMPPGVTADVLSIVATEDLSAGNFVNIHVGGVRKADASAVGKEADGFVLAAVLSGQSASVYFEGRNTSLTALTVGARYYLSGTIAGELTATPPSASASVVQYLGRATEATSLSFEATDGVILS
ncbi:hypothetical protein [Propionivibrio sp.]|uniref:hypothetical protein n=1 Tax=Propionivibrio sp. TaxID=2212460 RepID=UPI003BF41477